MRISEAVDEKNKAIEELKSYINLVDEKDDKIKQV